MSVSSIRLLCHNVYWFQSRPFSGDQPGAPRADVVDGLCRLYAAAESDVIALQEVHRAEVATAVAARLGLAVAHSPGGAYPHYGGAILWRGDGRLAADSRDAAVQRVWQLLRLERPDGPLTIANLHLPSNRQLGPERGQVQRVRDLNSLFVACDPPAIVCGDFNEPAPGGPVAARLAELGYRDAATLAGAEQQPSSVKGGRGDWLCLRADLVPRLLRYHAYVADDLRMADASERHLSDHLPIYLDLAVAASPG